jgi:NAD(P)-dependent dehydrogenase (short-subunit alcohol dehydrogenase family)
MSVDELFKLKGQVAVVTGGTGHLGAAISEGFAEAKAKLYIASRDVNKCKELAKFLERKYRIKVTGISLDISSMKSVKDSFDKIVNDAGKIDILVNNAAYSSSLRIEDASEKSWLEGIDGTINGVFRCTSVVLPVMIQQRYGSIINIASMYGMVSPDPSIYETSGFDNPPSYGAGKAAVIQFTRYVACNYAKMGIRANAISPGPFPSPEVQKNERFISNLIKKTPIGRIGRPEELKGVVIFLASKASSYVNGANIPVDGGWTTW